jgi:hypothetical protein
MRNLVNTGTLAAVLIMAQVLTASAANHFNLAFSTYICGMNGDYIRDVCVDNRGNIIAVGGTSSPDFPTTAGAYCRTYHAGGQSLGDFGPMDVFVMKFSASGQLLWSTFLGGSGSENAEGLSVDRVGDVYVTGTTHSRNFPTAGIPYQSTYGEARGSYDGNAFLTIMTPDLKSLVYSSFVGQQCSITDQNAYGGFHASALSPDGSWIVGGSWYSSNWPTFHALQTTYNPGGNGHAVLARFVPASRDLHPGSSPRRSK